VVFVLGTSSEFVSQSPDALSVSNLRPVSRGSLHVADVATATSAPLALASGATHLDAVDTDYEYFTSVSPVASGGYYWAAFTSRRRYGNLLTLDQQAPESKLIWITAIDVGAPPGVDPSHPAFVLPGQEIGTGNTRAVLSAPACGDPGTLCADGTECCSGYCGTGGGCAAASGPCGRVDERCGSQGDCCTGPANGVNGRPLYCVGGYCLQTLQ
jgi:hypothetical protein